MLLNSHNWRSWRSVHQINRLALTKAFAVISIGYTSNTNNVQNETAQSHILSRTFTACIQTARFKGAYSALIRYTDSYL